MSEHTSPALPDAADRAIDRAVRQMMSPEPPAGLRRRVLARLEGPAPRARLFPSLLVTTAAFAVLVLAVIVFGPAGGPSREDVQVAAPPVQSVPGPAAPLTALPAPVAAQPRAQASNAPAARRGLTSTAIPMPRISNVFGEQPATVAAASARGEGMVFLDSAPTDQLPGLLDPIGIPHITIAPLHVENIRVEAMPVKK